MRWLSASWPRALIRRYSSSSAMLRRRSLNCEMSAPATKALSPAPRRMTTRIASSVARSCTYFGISSHISWLTAFRFSGWLKTIQPIGPSFSSSSFGVSLMGLSSKRSRSMHHQAAVHADRLAGHVSGAARGEEGDHPGDVLGALHPPERHLGGALPGELLGRHAHQGALLARDQRPHVGLHEAGADAVHADAVPGVREGEALRDADDGGLARVVGEVVAVADLPGHGREAHDGAALLLDHRRQHGLAGEEHRPGVDAHDRVPVLLGDVEGRRGAV